MSQSESEQGPEVVLIEHKELDSRLNKLVDRAINAKAWSAAHEYVNSRYNGTQLAYAVHFLREKEMGHMPPVEATTRICKRQSVTMDRQKQDR